MSPTSMVSSIQLSLPSTVSSTINPHVQVVTLAESKKNDVNHHHRSVSDPSWGKFQPKWYIWMSAISLVFSSKLSLPSMVSSSTNSHVLSVVRHVESVNNFHVNHHNHSISHHILVEENFNWSDTNSLVLFSLLFLPFTVLSTTKQHEQKLGKWGIHKNDFQWTSCCSSLVV